MIGFMSMILSEDQIIDTVFTIARGTPTTKRKKGITKSA